MKPRIILIVIGVIIVIGIILYIIFSLSGGTSVGNQSSNNGTSGAAVSVASAYPHAPTGTYFSVGTAHGTVQMNNFYAADSTQVIEDGVLMIKKTANYWITYDPANSTFWIAVSGTPFVTIRAAAEQDFLTTLGVSKTDACKLDVSVGAPYTSGSSASSQSVPLSFCAAL
jgi:hypothetical protein